MSKWILLLILPLASGIFFNCGSDAKKSDSTPPTKQKNRGASFLQDECPEGTLLTYENFGEAMMLEYCSTCHSRSRYEDERAGAPIAIQLDSAQDMATWRTRMIETLKVDAELPMPPSEHIVAADKQMLLEWLECGAPAESNHLGK